MIKFYNSLTRKKEIFTSIEKNKVKVYSCGPTVYSFQHIGNMRAAVFTDVLRKILKYFHYEVISVMNITDVGHLTSDEDDGEDKMLKAYKKENKNPYEIAKFYTDAYLNDLEKLNIELPNFLPRATDHIQEQINMILELEKNGFTYKTDDGIYFDVSKFEDYGRLSGQSLEDKKSGIRVKIDSQKKNPQDFALWKFLTGDNANHVMKWESPWGIGFPGWHIECSAMANKYLGSKFDIHTGGIEHIPVHHENEIAQNVCSGDIKQVNFWIHNEHMMINNEKMSKSLGNIYTLTDLTNKEYSALALREVFLRSHYRKQMNFTFESLESGNVNVKKINDFYIKMKNFAFSEGENLGVDKIAIKRLDEFELALKDDMNTPLALASVYEFINDVNKKNILGEIDVKTAINFMERTNKVLGLIEKKEKIPENIIEIAKMRRIARDNKDFKKSDELRNKINELGYEIKDSKDSIEGFILSKKI